MSYHLFFIVKSILQNRYFVEVCTFYLVEFTWVIICFYYFLR